MYRRLLPAIALAFAGAGFAVQPTAIKPMNPATGTSPLAGPNAGGPMALSLEGRDAFARLDVNNDGALTRAEAAQDPLLAQSFAQADTDGDGRLQVGEFARSKRAADRVSTDAPVPAGG